jgi:hypothetical protein
MTVANKPHNNGCDNGHRIRNCGQWIGQVYIMDNYQDQKINIIFEGQGKNAQKSEMKYMQAVTIYYMT